MLTLGEIEDFFKDLVQSKKYTRKQARELPIYIGDDEELNGIHEAYYIEEANEETKELIDYCNLECKGDAIIIS